MLFIAEDAKGSRGRKGIRRLMQRGVLWRVGQNWGYPILNLSHPALALRTPTCSMLWRASRCTRWRRIDGRAAGSQHEINT